MRVECFSDSNKISPLSGKFSKSFFLISMTRILCMRHAAFCFKGVAEGIPIAFAPAYPCPGAVFRWKIVRQFGLSMALSRYQESSGPKRSSGSSGATLAIALLRISTMLLFCKTRQISPSNRVRKRSLGLSPSLINELRASTTRFLNCFFCQGSRRSPPTPTPADD